MGRSKKKVKSVQSVEPLDLTLREHPTLPDVWVNDELLILNLGLLQNGAIKFFYCLHCGSGVPLRSIRNHLSQKGHTSCRKNLATRNASDHLSDYGVPPARPHYTGDPIPWMPALGKPQAAFRCELCPPEDLTTIINGTGKDNHRKEAHRDFRLHLPTKPIFVQKLFCSNYMQENSKPPQVAYNPNQAPSSTTSDAEAGAARMLENLFRSLPSRNPRSATMPNTSNLAEINPFLRISGYAELVEGLDRNSLVRAVETPELEDPLYPIRESCESLFQKYQDLIQHAHPTVRRKWMASSSSQVIFNPVGDAGTDKYTGRMIRLAAFVVRVEGGLAISNAEGKHLNLFLTKDQTACAKRVRASLAKGGETLRDNIHDLLVSCFAPTEERHLSRNSFNDIVQVFCALASINRYGQFSSIENMTSPLAGVQYIMRAALLQHVSTKLLL
ncbi:hypothetical protein FRC08_017836 [Ceratobasidium sp. 394]|nr:hypothetical protein FRC08_017836 [Ceratobasidium sp. 394]